MDKKKVQDLIADQIIANVRCVTCAEKAGRNLDKVSVYLAADAIIENLRLCIENRMKWPEQVPAMSKTGQERLQRLVRRADHLERRIAETDPAKEVGRDSAELSALRWAIDVIQNVGVIEEEGPFLMGN